MNMEIEKLEGGIILGEMGDLKYFILKRNRMLSRGYGVEATDKVDKQIEALMDAYNKYISERIRSHEIIEI